MHGMKRIKTIKLYSLRRNLFRDNWVQPEPINLKLESETLDRVKCALKNGAIEGFHETFTTQWTKLIPQNGQVGVELRARLCEVSGARSNNSPIKLLVTRAGSENGFAHYSEQRWLPTYWIGFAVRRIIYFCCDRTINLCLAGQRLQNFRSCHPTAEKNKLERLIYSFFLQTGVIPSAVASHKS